MKQIWTSWLGWLATTWRCAMPFSLAAHRGRRYSRAHAKVFALSIGALLLLLLHGISWAGGVVSEPTEAALRSATAGGGLVTFAFDGTIVLSHTILIATNTVLDATGHRVTVSGNNSVQVLRVNTNVDLTISNLAIANGLSEKGGGVYNAGGQLILQNCTLVNNSAVGRSAAYLSGTPGTNGYGGAVYNLGVLNASNCSFVSNSAVAGAGAASPSFGTGGNGGNGNGGAIANFGISMLTSCLLAKNFATGGGGGEGGPTWTGGAGGDGNGGGIGNFGSLLLMNCLLASNSVTGGVGGVGGNGPYGDPAINGAPGGAGGCGNGGALFNDGSAVLVNNTLAVNSGAGGQGGAGGSGGPPMRQYTSSGSGGQGGNGGSGYGGIDDLSGRCYLTNCTLALNQATPGVGGVGGPPGPYPYPRIPHYGSPGGNGASGAPGCGLNTTGALLLNTLLASNTPANGAGTITDAGHNLSSDASLAFPGRGNLINVDPRLALLADNGGRTLTMALLPGSPAIDAGYASGAPAIDQRGVTRPQGTAVDIGAFEFQYMPLFTAVSVLNATNCELQMSGLVPNDTFYLLVSTNLRDWITLTNFAADLNGHFRCVVPMPGNCQTRFYRTSSPRY